MVDARYGRGGTTARRLRDALIGRRFTAARRRGKLMVLDTGTGPSLGVRFGMTGGLVVDGAQALDRLRYGPGVFDEKWVRARFTFADGGEMLVHDPRRFGSLELAPDESRLGPDALSVTRKELEAALSVPPGRARGCGAPEGPPDGPAPPRRRGQPAGRRDPVAGRDGPGTPYAAHLRRGAGAALRAALDPAPAGPARRLAHRRGDGGAPCRGSLSA